jgi:hypothetical protein
LLEDRNQAVTLSPGPFPALEAKGGSGEDSGRQFGSLEMAAGMRRRRGSHPALRCLRLFTLIPKPKT